jgi:hypothetical protein
MPLPTALAARYSADVSNGMKSLHHPAMAPNDLQDGVYIMNLPRKIDGVFLAAANRAEVR